MARPAVAGLLALLAVTGCAISRPPRGGTTVPYTVGGATYRPLHSWHGYEEEGLASWYGPGYHGRATASGEPFDTNALTAAHTILPMQVCVRVDSMETGQRVTVRINDRGPFVAGRVIDLSRAAAVAIGLLGPGVARVRLAATALADPSGRCPGAAASLTPAPQPGPRAASGADPLPEPPPAR